MENSSVDIGGIRRSIEEKQSGQPRTIRLLNELLSDVAEFADDGLDQTDHIFKNLFDDMKRELPDQTDRSPREIDEVVNSVAPHVDQARQSFREALRHIQTARSELDESNLSEYIKN